MSRLTQEELAIVKQWAKGQFGPDCEVRVRFDSIGHWVVTIHRVDDSVDGNDWRSWAHCESLERIAIRLVDNRDLAIKASALLVSRGFARFDVKLFFRLIEEEMLSTMEVRRSRQLEGDAIQRALRPSFYGEVTR